MEFVRDRTDPPVPRVLAFEPSHKNDLGFEWAMMEKMPGRPLCEQWNYMTWDQKEELVKRLAEIWAQVFRHKFREIGNIYQTAKPSLHEPADCTAIRSPESATDIPRKLFHVISESPPLPSATDIDKNRAVSGYCVGRIVSMPFLWHHRLHYDVYRGPFDSSFDWLAARLTFVTTESDAIINQPGGDQQRKAFSGKYSSIAKRLRQQLQNFFPPDTSCPREVTSEITTIHHHESSGYNFLVNEEGRLTALLDWDSVSTVPLWKACQMLEFLLLWHIDDMEDAEETCRTNRDCRYRDVEG